MPLTKKGKLILRKLKQEYGDKAESVFYAMINSGKLTGVEKGKNLEAKSVKSLGLVVDVRSYLKYLEDESKKFLFIGLQ